MNIFEAIIIVLRLLSIFTASGLYIYMIYAIIKNTNSGIGNGVSLIILPLRYIFIKNETLKKKIIILGLFSFSIIIFILTMKKYFVNDSAF
jgi:hypothetical protein